MKKLIAYAYITLSRFLNSEKTIAIGNAHIESLKIRWRVIFPARYMSMAMTRTTITASVGGREIIQSTRPPHYLRQNHELLYTQPLSCREGGLKMGVKERVRIATAKDVIATLAKMPADSPVYFDCPSCGKANGFHRLSIAVMVTTEVQP